MRILFLTHAFNSLTQRLFVVLREQGHTVSVEFDIHDAVAIEAVELFRPDLIIAPFLKRAIPAAIWRRHVCLIVHPGIPGDRGPSSLDWAILNREPHWGVTVLQANAEMDAGDIWASSAFPLRVASKASLYRNEVTQAAVEAVLRAVAHYQRGDFLPQPQQAAELPGQPRPPMRQQDRAIDWQRDDSATVLRKIRSADGFPGVRDTLYGREVYLYDAQPESTLRGAPGTPGGTPIARSGPAICRATVDGAVWIGHLRDPQGEHPFKLPAIHVLGDAVAQLPEISADAETGYREIWYEQRDQVGYVHFPFYNGAMSTAQCERLREAYVAARARDTRVIVLMGGADFWSNGMHLNLIEAADSAADESWRNINAIDDLAAEIINTTSQLTIAALRGNAGAGGVFLARAADLVWARDAVILNPHYKDMGNLYGSEYWTYLLPRYAGKAQAEAIAQARLPMGVGEAREVGLVDEHFGVSKADFESQLVDRASRLAHAADYAQRLAAKHARRLADEAEKPLSRYRDEELEKMKHNFYGFDPSYHVARYNFVYKVAKSRTPLTLASHRRRAPVIRQRKVS